MKKGIAHVYLAFFDFGQMGVAGSDDQRKTAHREALRFAQFGDPLSELSLSIIRFHKIQGMGYND